MSDEQRDPVAELAATFQALADNMGRALTAWMERHRPFLEALGRLAQDPGVQAYIAARKSGWEPERARPCHCLCGTAHPGDKGICDGNAVATRHFETRAMGPVDVPLCAPCAVAQGSAQFRPAMAR